MENELEKTMQNHYPNLDACDARDAVDNLSGFLSTLIEMNNETKVVKNDPNDR
jgi:hypothetical protein